MKDETVNDKFHGDYEGEYPEEDVCEGCGQIDGCCPLCCGFTYSPGSELCDWCEYEQECMKFAKKL